MKKLLFLILSTFVFTSCVTIQQRNAYEIYDFEDFDEDVFREDEEPEDDYRHSWYIKLERRMMKKAKKEAEKERRANLTPEQRRLEDEQRAEKERLAAEVLAAKKLERLKWVKYFESYPPQISFNGGLLSGEFSIEELNSLSKIIISKNKKSAENYKFQIKSCKVNWMKEDGTRVTSTLKRGHFKPIKTILANAKSGQVFTFYNIKVNVFENKVKVHEYSSKEALTIIVK